MISILASALALSPGAPKLEQRVTARVAASRAALDSQQAALPTSLLADGDGGGIFGLIATVIVAGLGLFIVNFIKDAALEVGSQLPERANRISEQTSGGGGEQQQGFLYDDSGTGANNALPEKGLLKKSKQMKADGTRYAPWMVIDEQAVEARKKKRLDEIKKGTWKGWGKK